LDCPGCQSKNPQGAKFCVECGNKLEVVCPQCQTINSPSFKFCSECGNQLFKPLQKATNDLSFDEKLEKIQRYLPEGVTEKILSQRDRIEGERKLVTVLFCGMGAVTRAPVGIWRSLPETRRMAELGLQEIIAVASARNISLPEEALQIIMTMYDGLVPQSTASLQRDIMVGRPSEMESQIGAVKRFGQEADVATPLFTFIYQSLLPMELRARGQLQFFNYIQTASSS